MKVKNINFVLCCLLSLISTLTAQDITSNIHKSAPYNTLQHSHTDCSGECYVEPDYVMDISMKLPFAEEERNVSVGVIDNIAYYQGDIILGKINDILQKGVGRDNARWSNSTIPYNISAGFSSHFSSQEITKINNAAATITQNTNLCIIPRTTEANYVNFVTSTGCSSYVGMIGGAQNINLASGCSFGSTIHEILHASGIYHEQSRQDRNSYVVIHWANIIPVYTGNFVQQIANATDYGSYDYNSIMHYGTTYFSNNGLPTITTIPAGIPIGQRNGLSAGDIATVNAMYPISCSIPCPNNRNVTTNYTSGNNIDLEASNTITASNTIFSGATVDYDAGIQIDLLNGFHARYGCDFDAFIDGCGGLYLTSNEEEIPDYQSEMLKTATATFDAGEVGLRNYPNPFTGTTTIEYTLPKAGKASLTISDISGKTVANPIQNKTHEAGTYTLKLDATTLPPGIYIATLRTPGTLRIHKMTVFE